MDSPFIGSKGMDAHLRAVDEKLKSLIPNEINGLGRLLQANGKRYRPQLVISIALLSGKKIDNVVIDAATAVELVHVASLVHDDIMDGGSLRWGVPTINTVEGDATAILAGDYLLAKACAVATHISTKAGEIVAETIADLCKGQAVELNNLFNPDKNPETCIIAARGKTSSLFNLACVLGGMVGQMPVREVKKLTRFAENFGIYYQCIDDITDLIGSDQTTGKSIGTDIIQGNYTLPILYSLQCPNKSVLRKFLISKHVPITKVIKLLKEDGSIYRAQHEAEKYKYAALRITKDLENVKLANSLQELISRV